MFERAKLKYLNSKDVLYNKTDTPDVLIKLGIFEFVKLLKK